MMAAYTCPQGHPSDSGDYCDVCGSPIPPGSTSGGTGANPAGAPAMAGGATVAAPPPAPVSVGPTKACPNCTAVNAEDSLFCEDCGYDFTTGQLPPAAPAPAVSTALPPSAPPATPAPVASDWVAEVWVDPDWYAQEGDTAVPCPSAGPPKVVPLPATGALIGRRSKSRNIHPELDCGSDTSVSRRQAQLSLDGTKWYLEDLESTNGTFAGPAGAALPSDPIPVGTRREIGENDRIYVGSWTRIVVRKATPEEAKKESTF